MPRPLLEEKELIEIIRRKLLTRMSADDDMLRAVSPGEALIALAILHSAAVISDDLQDIPVSINDISFNPD